MPLFVQTMYSVAHKKWNIHSLRRSSSRTVLETISVDRCTEGWSYCTQRSDA